MMCAAAAAVVMAGRCQAQNDTLKLDFSTAERLFEERNLLVRARKMEALGERSLIPQAKAWDNPNLYLEQNIYNQFTRSPLPLGANGETVVQLEQLIRLAGKRSKAAKVQEQSAKIQELFTDETVRALKYELRVALGDLDHLRRVIDFYNRSVKQMEEIVEKYREQHARGNLSLSEKIRVESLFHDTAVERLEYKTAYSEREATIRLLIGEESNRPVVANIRAIPDVPVPVLTTLIQTALDNRPDLKIRREKTGFQERLLQLERANAVPDLAFGYVYDKAGNFINNYHAFSLSMDIPVFNRNKGRIEQANYLVNAAQRETEHLELLVRNELVQTLDKLKELDVVYDRYGPEYLQDYDKLMSATFENYLKRNVGFLEFADLFESYKQTVLTSERLYNERRQIFEFLSFTCATQLFD
jgi:cobalt-zinc-cadmium efflux system outer membrane protein